MSRVICLNCEAMGSPVCHLCRSEREAAAGGEQGLSPLEVEVEGLRAQLAAAQEAHRVQLRATGDEIRRADGAEKAYAGACEQIARLIGERDAAIAELALLRVPGGKA